MLQKFKLIRVSEYCKKSMIVHNNLHNNQLSNINSLRNFARKCLQLQLLCIIIVKWITCT